MKYRCLVLDHDDTAVDSTAAVHFPAHLEMMRLLRPDKEPISLETWFLKNFNPGIMAYLTEEIGLNEQELEEEYRIWQEFNETRNPPFYSGLPELLETYISRGGIVAVASHSIETHIRRHYSVGAPGVVPHYVFGWDNDEQFRKPSPWPLLRIMEHTGCRPDEILVVDDLKPGVDMARAAGVAVAAAGWGHQIPEIQGAMRQLCDYWLKDIASLKYLLMGSS